MIEWLSHCRAAACLPLSLLCPFLSFLPTMMAAAAAFKESGGRDIASHLHGRAKLFPSGWVPFNTQFCAPYPPGLKSKTAGANHETSEW